MHQVALVTQQVVGICKPELWGHILKEDLILVPRAQETPHVALDPQSCAQLLRVLRHLPFALLPDEPNVARGVHCRLDAHSPSTPLRSHLRKSRGHHFAALDLLGLRRDVVVRRLNRLLECPVGLFVGASHCLLLRLRDGPHNTHHSRLRLELTLLR